MSEGTQIGINSAARMTGKNKSVIWRDTKAGKLSATLDAKGKTVYNIAELERVYGKLKTPEEETAYAVVSMEPRPIDLEAEKLAMKLEFLERELSMVKDQLDETKNDRDHWRAQAENVLRALPAPAQPSPAQAQMQAQQAVTKGFWPFKRRLAS